MFGNTGSWSRVDSELSSHRALQSGPGGRPEPPIDALMSSLVRQAGHTTEDREDSSTYSFSRAPGTD